MLKYGERVRVYGSAVDGTVIGGPVLGRYRIAEDNGETDWYHWCMLAVYVPQN